VAELADAQVSEACDGDIVEVQVLSSAFVTKGEPQRGSPFEFSVAVSKFPSVNGFGRFVRRLCRLRRLTVADVKLLLVKEIRIY
jgi:hypothetical protein